MSLMSMNTLIFLSRKDLGIMNCAIAWNGLSMLSGGIRIHGDANTENCYWAVNANTWLMAFSLSRSSCRYGIEFG